MKQKTHLDLITPSDKRVDSLVKLVSDFYSYLTRCRVSFIVSSGDVYRLRNWFITGSSTFVRYSGLLATGGQTTRTTGTSCFPSLRRFAAIRPWTDRQWLLRGVPIRQPTAALPLCTDALGSGWGTHLLPSFTVCSGLWAPHKQGLLCNEQELLAVLQAVTFWVSHLRGLCFMVLSDSTTVCAYIRKQGGNEVLRAVPPSAGSSHVLRHTRHLSPYSGTSKCHS